MQAFLNLVKNAAKPPAKAPITPHRPHHQVPPRRAPFGGPFPTRASACRCSSRSRTTATACPNTCVPTSSIPSFTTKHNGTGLGLALVAKIIGDHGGIIEYDSEPRRTVFRVLLPLQERKRGEDVNPGE